MLPIEEIVTSTRKDCKHNPYKPEKTEAQERNEQAKNQLMSLGGGHEIKEHGKRAIQENINNKPSNLENLYNYDPKVHHYMKKNQEDFPAFEKDGDGNLVSPVKQKAAPKKGLKVKPNNSKISLKTNFSVDFLQKLLTENVKSKDLKFNM